MDGFTNQPTYRRMAQSPLDSSDWRIDRLLIRQFFDSLTGARTAAPISQPIYESINDARLPSSRLRFNGRMDQSPAERSVCFEDVRIISQFYHLSALSTISLYSFYRQDSATGFRVYHIAILYPLTHLPFYHFPILGAIPLSPFFRFYRLSHPNALTILPFKPY